MSTRRTSCAVLLLLTSPLFSFAQHPDTQWLKDFSAQPVGPRPSLEVNYADASRTAFQVLAQQYRLTGELEKPHRLLDDNGRPWLWIEMETSDGHVYSTQYSSQPSRINLYRRGPYFCEVHWLDLQPATAEGTLAPVKGDLTLYCYPEKILAQITWHGTGAFDASKLLVQGIAPKTFDCAPFAEKTRQTFSLALFGETQPLSDEAFTLVEGKVPMQYDARKGCYVVGTVTSSSFQEQFYDTPNRYETATFTVHNDATPRKIYICHESVIGGAIVEGGAVLDESGNPMPIVVQISKNFAGEKEERFYNPRDTPFSETYFPLYLEPGETLTLSSLHLYQNWGRHMTKHWSSLGAWMDYFHSSTGVTETTCYVPFKFAGIGGVSIADFRAMSQDCFWSGQPQHDNLAGHGFLSFYDGRNWQHSKYESTLYRSTGPNWYDIQLNYISADGSVKITADIWETPQTDELRSFFHVRYEILKPLIIDDAQAHFRFLTVTSAIQRLRFSRFAASGIEDQEIDFSRSPFPIKGTALPSENAFLAVYGDHVQNRGSNAVLIRKFTGPRGIGPAVSLQTGPYRDRSRLDRKEDTRLLLVPNVEQLQLNAGDVFEISGFWLPYGSRDDAETPRRETVIYGVDAPKVTSCTHGTVLSDLPVKIKAHENRAEFTIQGGRDLLPVIVTGLTDWKYPRIWRKENDRWRLLSHARNTDHDGYQVFSEQAGKFGAVFLVGSDNSEQTLRVSVGNVVPDDVKITLNAGTESTADQAPPPVTFLTPEGNVALTLAFPQASPAQNAAHSTETPSAIHWKSSEGGSLWFEADEGNWRRGGRINPNQDDMDLEYWWQNGEAAIEHTAPQFLIDRKGTPFEDPENQRTWILTAGGWQKPNAETEQAELGAGVIAVVSDAGNKILCIAWPKAGNIIAGKDMGVALQPVPVPPSKRYHVRGKVYLIEGDLEILKDRICKETTIF